MREYITTKCGIRIMLNTAEEDSRILEAALADPDAPPFTDEELEAAIPHLRRGYYPAGAISSHPNPQKASVMLQLDVDILEKLKASGTEWQTRVNDVMRDWLKQNSA